MKKIESHSSLKACAAALLCLASGAIWAGMEGDSSTHYGAGAGFMYGDSGQNTFIGRNAGYNNGAGGNTFLGYAAGFSNYGSFNTYLGLYAGYANESGRSNVFLGYNAGRFNTTGNYNLFLGNWAGYNHTTGEYNTFIGSSAGQNNITGRYNTAVGGLAGSVNSTGQRNVFLGWGAGGDETGSNKLYIDSCYSGGNCTSPFIYGEFDNHLLRINGEVGIAADGAAKSQLHFSQSGTDVGGWLTSVADNNFFMSSGAKYDAAAGGWIQKSGDGKAVMAGSGSSGYRVYTNQGAGVGSSFAPASRLHIDYSGNFGLNTLAVAGQPITTGTGAILSAGGAWLNASSRERKENIKELAAADAHQTLAMLNPVSFNYKVDSEEKHVGFIAEDVPEMVASKDRKSLSALDIVAVLTKVVQEQQQVLEQKSRAIGEAQTEVALLKEQLFQLTAEVRRLSTNQSPNYRPARR
jgi:endosialidase-like protein